MRGLVALLALLLSLAALPLRAQDAATGPQGPAILIADRVEVRGRDLLVAEGNVEALYGDVRLKADRITYDRAADKLTLEGPVTLTQGERVVLIAEGGTLDPRLENGLLRGARMVLDRQVQMAAHQIDRVGGRYTQLYKVAATSCQVCGSDRPPLWQIRARRAIHDEAEKQIYFDSAQFRVLDVPIFWVPRLRLPDPSLDRATGFLFPSLRQRSQLGLGIKVPYFIKMGDHRDLTLTPYLSQNTRTLEWRYRQAFATGDLHFEGALSRDNIGSGLRGYVFGEGVFALPHEFRLTFDVEAVTDRAYLADYGYSEKDRLDSEIAVTRTRRDEFIRAGVIGYQTLREDERNAEIPSIIADLAYERRLFPAALGGELRLSMGAHAHHRYSDDEILGRDMRRADADIAWLRSWTLPGGLQAALETGVALDGFAVHQDSTSVRTATEVTPRAGLTLRWPLMRQEAGGATQVLEPLLMLGWTGGSDPAIPNEESTRVEFDEGNLLSLSRFPAPDRRERGWQVAYGLNWTRLDPKGWSAGVTIGHVVRERALPDFTDTSGLDGAQSDLLLALQYRGPRGLVLTGRSVFDSELDLSKAEARAALIRPEMAFGASYVWLGRDPAENRPNTVSEWSLDGSYRLSQHWTATGNWRYDVASGRTAEAGLGVEYRNECVELRLSLSRRFTSSTIVEPSTDFGFSVGLRGFSARTADRSYTRTCRN